MNKPLPHERTPRIGMWASVCCEIDLYQIETQEDLDFVLDDNGDEDIYYSFFDTKEDGVAYFMGLTSAPEAGSV